MNMADQLILIVDDMPENIQVALNVLKPLGTALAFARSAEEARQVMQGRKPSLMLLDVMMPGTDGFTFCRQLKSEIFFSDIPIIFLTAKRDIDDIVKGFEYGAIDYIVKPFNRKELYVRVKTHLQNVASQERLKMQVRNLIDERNHLKELLIQQSKMASVGEMLASISHQWKQPLTAISLNTANSKISEMLKTQPDTDLLNHLDNIQEQIDFMMTTMHDFRNFFQPDSTKKAFSLIETCFELINLFSKNFMHSGCVISLHTPDEHDIRVFGYENMFKQAILNIIDNAIDAIVASGTGDHRIDIECRAEGEMGIVTVSNYAGSIPDDIKEHIFEQFYTTKKSEGTGIGLSMAKQIMEELQKGGIRLENFDNGVRFVLSIPLAQKETQA